VAKREQKRSWTRREYDYESGYWMTFEGLSSVDTNEIVDELWKTRYKPDGRDDVGLREHERTKSLIDPFHCAKCLEAHGPVTGIEKTDHDCWRKKCRQYSRARGVT
jgi:hypothetical protein